MNEISVVPSSGGWVVGRQRIPPYWEFYSLSGIWSGSGTCFEDRSDAAVVASALTANAPVPSGYYTVLTEIGTKVVTV
jgi:hypothetical protein